jgi:uncharacterized YigZ family protein
MVADDTYLTIAHPSEGVYKEKGSRFIAFACPVLHEDEIKELLATIRKDHFSAKHCCYAWTLGVENARFRMNDDGEPQGTAGRPIYGQIQSFGLKNIMVVVVRYFGGTLLGVSGLIRAYKQATIEAIANAEIVTRIVELNVEIEFNYLSMNAIMHFIKEEHLEIIGSNFDMKCSVLIKVRMARLNEIISRIENKDGVLQCRIKSD